jgi:fluoroquinolone transport system permease protein
MSAARRIAAALRGEALVQGRHGFYAVTAVVVGVWVGVLLLLPDPVRENPAALAPMFVVTNLQVTAFYFAAALLLLERSQGTLSAIAVSPLRPGEYLAARAASLAVLGATESIAVARLAFGADARWGWLLAGSAACGAIYALLGTVAVAPHAQFNRFLLVSMAWLAGLSLPLFGLYGVVPAWTLAWHPLSPPLVLLRAAWAPVPAGALAYGVAGSVVATALCAAWARRAWTSARTTEGGI